MAAKKIDPQVPTPVPATPPKSLKAALAKSKTVTPGKVSALTRARTALTKVLKEDHVVPLNDDMMTQSIPHLPTGSIIFDYAIGGKINRHGISPCPGLPRGRITQLYGQNSSGKTTAALTIAASVCAAGGTVVYIDWEHEVVPQYAATLGVPIADESKFLLIQPDTLEEGMKIMLVMISEGVDLIVLDSVGAGVPDALVTRSIEDTGAQSRPGLVASIWSTFLPQVKAAIAASGTTILAISQLRKTISSMSGGGPDSAPQGGEAWKYYTTVRIMLRVFQKEKAKQFDNLTGKTEDKVVGSIVILKMEKCKVSESMNNEFKFYLRNGYGIDNTRSVAELAISYKIIQKGGSWYTWPSGGPRGDIKTQGMEPLLKILNEDPPLLALLFSQVTPKLMAAPSNTEIVDEEEVEALDMDELLGSVPGTVKKKPVSDGEEADPDLG